jgi:hypothetical protein
LVKPYSRIEAAICAHFRHGGIGAVEWTIGLRVTAPESNRRSKRSYTSDPLHEAGRNTQIAAGSLDPRPHRYEQPIELGHEQERARSRYCRHARKPPVAGFSRPEQHR